MRMLTIAIRTTTLLALLVGMPLLALPRVNAGLSEWAGDIYHSHFYATNLTLPNSSISPIRNQRDSSQVDESVQWQARGDEAQPSVDLRSEKPALQTLHRNPAGPRYWGTDADT